MKLRKLIQSDYGKIVISIVLGFGLATLFRKTCKNEKCMRFRGPSMDNIKDNVYKHDGKCYQFNPSSIHCSSTKRTVKFA